MTISTLYEGYIVPASTLLPIIAGFTWYKKLGKATHALLYYLVIALLINMCGVYLAAHRTNNLPLLHFYTMFELVAVMWYYQRAFNTPWATRCTAVIMLVYPILCVINFTFFQSIYQFNTYTRPLEAVIIIIFSGIYLAEPDHKVNDGNAGRWIASGFILYFFSSLFQFVFSNLISHQASHGVKVFIWNLHDTFVLIMYIFFFVAIKHERGKR